MLTSTQRRSKGSSDVTGGIARRASAAAAATLCLWLTAPTFALAGGTNYFGPIDQPGNTESPAVYLKVGTKDKKPIELRRFAAYEPAAFTCQGGTYQPEDGLYFPQVKFPKELLPLPITKRSFSGRAEDSEGFFEITGTVPRKGPARGTVQLTTISGPLNDSYCDTGVLSWEAPVYNNPY
jgi:hypothetical protein